MHLRSAQIMRYMIPFFKILMYIDILIKIEIILCLGMGDIEIKPYKIPTKYQSQVYGFNHTFNAKYDNIHVH